MRCILLSCVLAVVCVAASARADDPAEPGDPGMAESAEPGRREIVLETQMIPDLRQTIVYARFPEAIDATATLELLDGDGAVRAAGELPLVAGTGLFVWDGRGGDGELVPSGPYVARLTFAGEEWTAPLVR